MVAPLVRDGEAVPTAGPTEDFADKRGRPGAPVRKFSVLARLDLRDFRCFSALRIGFVPGVQFFTGANARGKTSILEGVCALLRLASPRAATLAPLVRAGAENGFGLRGEFGGRQMEFQYGPERRRLVLDDVEQPSPAAYLRVARLVYFGNADLELVRGGSEGRRRFLDFLGAQIEPLYRANLRAYERALRSRNRLLKTAPGRRREIEAFDGPLLEAGTLLTGLRRALVAALGPWAARAQAAVSGRAADGETLALRYVPGAGEGPDFPAALRESRAEETRRRQTLVGPHRDDLALALDDRPAGPFASEGQQRTLALALKLAQAGLLESVAGAPPLLLLDDIFGELDPDRRNRLLAALPTGSQRLVTTTHLGWLDGPAPGPVWRLEEGGQLTREDDCP